MLSLRDVLKEFVFPLRTPSVLLAVGFFMFLFMLVSIATQLSTVVGFAASLIIGIGILPGLIRLFLLYLDARARDRAPLLMEAEHLSWMSDRWSLFTLPLAAASGWLLLSAHLSAVDWLFPLTLMLTLSILPAMLIVLTMTQSPLQAIHPGALTRLMIRLRGTYWLAPLTALLAFFVVRESASLPLLIFAVTTLYCTLVCFGIFGAVLRPGAMADDIDLPQVEVEAPPFSLKARESALNLAYSFMSRDGVENGIKHIEGAIREEGDSMAAWQWYFERMLTWEKPFYACRFAQRYIKELLIEDDVVGVTKLILRCRLLDPTFKPYAEDREAVCAALERSGNAELANSLQR